MKKFFVWQLGMAIPLAFGAVNLNTLSNYALAQLTPDNTLGAENSIVTPQQLRDLIQGGAIRDNTLFHSFDEFNVGSDRGVFFDLQNNTDILNIFTRVTGSNSSNILGTLGVLQDALNSNILGNANLFLLNPNGITFGGNASLQLNGSFFATTADGFGFDNFTFSASGGEAPPPLLAVSIPPFLSFRDNPGDIAVNQSNLTVNQGQNISLIGGNVTINGGFSEALSVPTPIESDRSDRTGVIQAPGGRVELGGLSGAGIVTINPDSSLTFPENVALGDVTLTGGSSVYVRSNGGGDINVNAANLLMTGRSELFAGIESGTTNPSAPAGDIVVNATESVRIESIVDPVNTGNNNFIQVTETAIRNHVGGFPGVTNTTTGNTQGNAGDITVNTPVLQLVNGGRITSKTFGLGNAGDVTTNTNSIVLDGIFSSLISQVVGANSTGISGDITVNTNSFVMQSSQNSNVDVSDLPPGPSIFSATRGAGTSGDTIINADNISITDRSVIINLVQGDSTGGSAGSVFITTDTLDLSRRSRIRVGSGIGNAGSVSINANSITFSSQGNILSNASGSGNVGNVNITANSLSLTGENTTINSNTSSQGNAGDINLEIDEFINLSDSSFITAGSTNPGGNTTGNSGSININTERLTITNNSFVSVNNLGSGNAGDIEISGGVLNLDGNASITANNNTGTGGDVEIDNDVVLLRNTSEISATGSNSDVITLDGNISIDTRALVLLEGSQIFTNSSASEGGSNIDIDSDLVFLSPDSFISATGDLNINSDLILEPTEPPEVEIVDPSDTVSQSVCSDFGGDSQLNNTGRGGIPQIPGLIPRNDVVDVELVDEVLPAPPPEAIKPHHRTDVTFIDSEGEEFKPAMGAVSLPNGMVQFVDYNPAEVYRDMYAAAGCNN